MPFPVPDFYVADESNVASKVPQIKCSWSPTLRNEAREAVHVLITFPAMLENARLRSLQAKTIWAHQHLDALRLDILNFGRSEPCAIVHDFDPKTIKHTWRVTGKPDTPPQQLSLRLGDTLNNFRAVLRSLASQKGESSCYSDCSISGESWLPRTLRLGPMKSMQ
jgi:hypothetical protein